MAIRGAPIVLIHGIKGSHLAQTYDDSFDVIWSGVQNRFESIWDLELDDRGEVERDPWDLVTVLRIEKVAYGELLGRLRKRFPNVPVYIFRYDWRLDLVQTAVALDRFLQRLSKKTRKQTFRIVTHSMGGLVLSAYLKLDPENNLRTIDRAVLAAPPFWGAVEAVRGLVVGDPVPFGFNSSEAYRKVARTFPSAYQLVSGYPNAWMHPNPEADIWNIEDWQRRVRFGTRKKAVYDKRDELMQRHLTRARAFHTSDLIDFASLPETERARFLLLYGKGEKTRVKIMVRQHNQAGDIQNFFDFDADGCWGDGDGTVPAVSAERYRRIPRIAVNLSDFSAWWPSLWGDKARLKLAGFHAMFLALDKVQGLVVDCFAGEKPKASWAEPIKP